jgi:Holliday junction resolvase RusA-like endonuclease
LNEMAYTFDISLMSKARPRFVAGKVPYMPKQYMKWRKDLRAKMAEWWTDPPLEHVERMDLTFKGPARYDLDNLAGAVLDAGQDLVWTNDRCTVIPTLNLRWTKCKPADSSIYLKVYWK